MVGPHGFLFFPQVDQVGIHVHVFVGDLGEVGRDPLLLLFVLPIDLVELLSLLIVLRLVPRAALLNLPHQVLIIEVYLLLVFLLFILQLVQLSPVDFVVRLNRFLYRLESLREFSELKIYFIVNVCCFLIDFLFVLLDLVEDLCLEAIVTLFIILLNAFKAVAHRLPHILDLPQHLLCDQRVEFTELFCHKIATWSVGALS